MRKYNFIVTAIVIAIFLLCSKALAETYVNKTRIIISQADKETSFSIVNEGSTPALMQLWIDNGDPYTNPGHISVPFLVLPPVFRLEPKKSFAARVIFTGKKDALPADRESMFWLNILEVPPKTDLKPNENTFQMAFRTRVKLFFRPLKILEETQENAVKKTHLTILTQGGGKFLRIENRSALHITLIDILTKGTVFINDLPNDGVISPFGKMDIPLINKKDVDVKDITFSYINDFGVLSY